MGHNKVAGQPASAVDSTSLFSLERRVRLGFALAAVALIVVGILTYISVLRFRCRRRSSRSHPSGLQRLIRTGLQCGVGPARLRHHRQGRIPAAQSSRRPSRRSANPAAPQPDGRQSRSAAKSQLPSILVAQRLRLMGTRVELRKPSSVSSIPSLPPSQPPRARGSPWSTEFLPLITEL